MSDDQRQAWRLLAGEWDSLITCVIRMRRIAAQSALTQEVAHLDGYLGILQYDRRNACLEAGYQPPEEVLAWVDEEADTHPVPLLEEK